MYPLNKIYTDAEYLEQGYTKEETKLAREADMLYNEMVRNGGRWMSEITDNRYHFLAEKLGW